MPETTTAIATTAPVTEGELTTLEDLTAEAVTETIETTARDYWTPENLIHKGRESTVPILLKGMLGIFLVMGIIILCVTLLNNFTSPDRKKKREEKKAAKAQAKNNNKQ